MRDFKKLDIWKRSLDFSIAIYEKTKTFPAVVRYGLTSQIRRAATSIPINIAEGSGRSTNKDYAHFLQIAEGSANEVECELIIANRLCLIQDNDFQQLNKEVNEIKKMIGAYKAKILM